MKASIESKSPIILKASGREILIAKIKLHTVETILHTKTEKILHSNMQNNKFINDTRGKKEIKKQMILF